MAAAYAERSGRCAKFTSGRGARFVLWSGLVVVWLFFVL